jgi:uncharacterized protein (TIGR01244 family)
MKRRLVLARFAAGAAGLVLAGATAAAAGGTDIDKFFRVNEGVATGGQPSTAQLAALKAEGFRTVVNLREPGEHDAAAEEAAAKDLGLIYVNIPVRAAEPRPEQVDAFLRVTADPSIYPAFLHCASGNRVGAFWMIRRVLVDGWTPACAEKEAEKIGLKSPSLRTFALEYIAANPRKGAEAPCSDGF